MQEKAKEEIIEITGKMLDEQVRKALYVLLTRSMQEGLGTSATGFANAFKLIVDSMDDLRAKRIFDEEAPETQIKSFDSYSWKIENDHMVFHNGAGGVMLEVPIKDVIPEVYEAYEADELEPECFVYGIRRKQDGAWLTRSRGFLAEQKTARIYRRKSDATSSMNKSGFGTFACEVVKFGCLEM